MTRKPYRIDFYKRKSTSIEQLDHLEIVLEDQTGFIYKNGAKIDEISPETFYTWENHLTQDFKEAFQEEYFAFDYEIKDDNYALKFFLKISYTNHTFLAIKGIKPFQQIHYHDILNFFLPLLEKEDKA